MTISIDADACFSGSIWAAAALLQHVVLEGMYIHITARLAVQR